MVKKVLSLHVLLLFVWYLTEHILHGNYSDLTWIHQMSQYQWKSVTLFVLWRLHHQETLGLRTACKILNNSLQRNFTSGSWSPIQNGWSPDCSRASKTAAFSASLWIETRFAPSAWHAVSASAHETVDVRTSFRQAYQKAVYPSGHVTEGGGEDCMSDGSKK